MRRLLAFILSLLLILNTLVGIAVGVFDFSDHADIRRIGAILVIFLFNAFLLQTWREKLRRKLPPRDWVRPKSRREKKQRPARDMAPIPSVAPARQERAFAPVPLAQSLKTEPVAAEPSMPDRLRNFILHGDRAIHAQHSQAVSGLGGGQSPPFPDNSAPPPAPPPMPPSARGGG